MGKVVILFGFCTAGKSRILREFIERFDNDNIKIKDLDTDKKISGRKVHIYNIYISLYKERGDGKENIKDALDYIERKERELLVELANDCLESNIPYIIAPGPFLVTREPEWSYFYKKVNPICYYLELTPEEVYDGLIKRRRGLEFDKIGKSKSFGCWDYNSITYYIDGEYRELCREMALKYIRSNMREPIKKYREFSGLNKIFSAIDIRNNNNLKDKLYNSIKNDLLLKL